MLWGSDRHGCYKRPLLSKQLAGILTTETGTGCACKRQVRRRIQTALSVNGEQVLHYSSAAGCHRRSKGALLCDDATGAGAAAH